MAKEYAEPFYKSKAWQDCRASFISERIAIDGGLCQRCGKRAGYIVHHIKYITPNNINDQSITLSHSNLEYLCHECHNYEHDYGREQKELLCGFDEKGRPIKNAITAERNEN